MLKEGTLIANTVESTIWNTSQIFYSWITREVPSELKKSAFCRFNKCCTYNIEQWSMVLNINEPYN